MFDLFSGLPVHILVLHAVVVLGPIAALFAIALAVRPTWRAWLKWPTLTLAVIATASALITKESGEQLEHRLINGLTAAQQADPAVKAQLDLVHEHTEMGDLAGAVGLVFGVVVILAIWFVLVPRVVNAGSRLQSSTMKTLASVLVVVVSLGFLGTVTLAGHTGAKAAWSDQISTAK